MDEYRDTASKSPQPHTHRPEVLSPHDEALLQVCPMPSSCDADVVQV